MKFTCRRETQTVAQNVPTWFVETYQNLIADALQYKGSKLRSAVTEGPASGEQAVAVDLIGQIAMKTITERLQPIARDDFPTNRVWMRPIDTYSAPVIDTFDKLRLDVTDPQSAVVRAAANGAKTEIDRIIAGAFFGDLYAGRSGATVVPFDNAQQVAVGVGGGNTLNAEKIFAGLQLMQEAEVDLNNEEAYLGITPADNRALLAEARIINGDFAALGGVIENGVVTKYAGVNVIVSTLFQTLVGGNRQLPLWVKSGVKLGVWQDVTVSIDKLTDIAGLPYQVHTTMTFGATRTEAGKVIRILAQ